MTTALGNYTFLPWLRNGVANRIGTADGDTSVLLRASIDVQLDIVGQRQDGSEFTSPLDRTIPLVGPGDIVGVDPRAIVRTDPRPWITNFEPSYLPAIEFYDEDFPWRYTPAAPDVPRHRLRPWLTLAVLTEDEFKEQRSQAGRPLPAIQVGTATLFPPADELWAWAHVHVMRALVPGVIVPPDTNAVLSALGDTLRENADLACSRLLSPRRLQPDTPYHAFLIPTFERGRLAGLGANPDLAPHATVSAWEAYTGRADVDLYPYYFRWFFRTGTIGDFEYLVRLLQPRPVDARVGTRNIDTLDPGGNLPPIDHLGGFLKLGGALRVPRLRLSDAERAIADQYDHWADPSPHPFQDKLATFINLADTYLEKQTDDANLEAGILEDAEPDPDPLITAPLYGRWHAETARLLRERDGTAVEHTQNWVHELNLDPRHRTAAGFGTQVIQDKQEDFMNAAWEQVGDVLAANQVVRYAQLALAASWRIYEQHFRPLAAINPERTFSLTAPVHGRIIQNAVTVRYATKESVLPNTATSAPLRRIARPGARLTRSLPFSAAQPVDALTRRIAERQVTAAPPKLVPSGVTTLDDIAQTVETVSVPEWARTILSGLPSAPTVVFVVAFVLALILWAVLGLAGFFIGAAIVAGGAVFRARLSEYAQRAGAAQSLSEREQTARLIDAIGPAPDFRLDPAAPPTPNPGGGDSPDAARLKTALRQVATATQVGATLATEPVRTSIDVRARAIGTLDRLNPSTTIPLRTWNVVQLPERIRDGFTGPLSEVMYYPEFDVAMYRPLADISSELFLPNLNLIPPNSITLLETNQRFIEAYMVGLNHEFSRELLWREYPTDARGSYFRQFWEVATYVDTQGRTPQQLREDLRDIPPIHTWPKTSALGEHDNREAEPGSTEEEVVLVIRGELLKRYPNAVIYAHRAEWPRIGNDPNGHIDRTKQRDLIEVTDAEISHPPASKLRFPLYEAKVDPDVYFFGFDLTAEAVIGGSGDQDTDDPGWFFVIKERPGEPRFGLDDGPPSTPADDKPQVWNDLTWGDAHVDPGGLTRVAALPTLSLKAIPSSSSDEDKKAQRDEDVAVSFSAATHAADLAYLLFQVPVLVAVHGAEMLRER